MTRNMAQEIAALQRMSVAELRGRYFKTFGEKPRSGHRQWLLRRIAWRIQALAYGDLSERARAGPRTGQRRRSAAHAAPIRRGENRRLKPCDGLQLP